MYNTKTVTSWVVERQDDKGDVKFNMSFDNYDDALDMFNELKELHEDSTISIHKKQQKLLLE